MNIRLSEAELQLMDMIPNGKEKQGFLAKLPVYLLTGMIAPTPFWWAASLLIWTGVGAYVLAGKVNAVPCLHALLAVAPMSALCLVASLDDGALLPMVAVMLIGAGVGAFIGVARRR